MKIVEIVMNFFREKREAFINLFKYAQQYYGQKVKQVISIRIQLTQEPDPATIKWDDKFYIKQIRFFSRFI